MAHISFHCSVLPGAFIHKNAKWFIFSATVRSTPGFRHLLVLCSTLQTSENNDVDMSGYFCLFASSFFFFAPRCTGRNHRDRFFFLRVRWGDARWFLFRPRSSALSSDIFPIIYYCRSRRGNKNKSNGRLKRQERNNSSLPPEFDVNFGHRLKRNLKTRRRLCQRNTKNSTILSNQTVVWVACNTTRHSKLVYSIDFYVDCCYYNFAFPIQQ